MYISVCYINVFMFRYSGLACSCPESIGPCALFAKIEPYFFYFLLWNSNDWFFVFCILKLCCIWTCRMFHLMYAFRTNDNEHWTWWKMSFFPFEFWERKKCKSLNERNIFINVLWSQMTLQFFLFICCELFNCKRFKCAIGDRPSSISEQRSVSHLSRI